MNRRKSSCLVTSRLKGSKWWEPVNRERGLGCKHDLQDVMNQSSGASEACEEIDGAFVHAFQVLRG